MPPTIISFSTNNDNKSIIQRATNIKKSVCFLYEIGSLHKTKGVTPNFISHNISSFFDTMKHTIYAAIHYRRPLPCTFTVSKSFITEHQKQFNRLYKPQVTFGKPQATFGKKSNTSTAYFQNT